MCLQIHVDTLFFLFLRGPGNFNDFPGAFFTLFNDFLNKSGLDAPFVQRKSGKISWIGWVVLRVIITRPDHLKIGFFVVVAFGIPRIAETFRLE